MKRRRYDLDLDEGGKRALFAESKLPFFYEGER